jgi:Rv0078B-related antitoxin
MNFAEKRAKREALFSLNSPEMEILKQRGEATRTGEERLRLTLEMSDEARKLALQQIREEHPEWTENEVMLDYVRWVFFPQELSSGMVEAILAHSYPSPDRKRTES